MKPWDDPEIVTTLHELKKFPDVKPCYMHGGHPCEELPFIMPIYGQSCEMEVADILYMLVRYLKPLYVVELGCHLGIGTYVLAKACKDNRMGRVITCDIHPLYCTEATNRCYFLDALDYVYQESSTSELMERHIKDADFLWLDCDYEGRINALKHMKSGAVACLHDTNQEQVLADAVNSLGPEYEHVSFMTHRGMSIIRRK